MVICILMEDSTVQLGKNPEKKGTAGWCLTLNSRHYSRPYRVVPGDFSPNAYGTYIHLDGTSIIQSSYRYTGFPNNLFWNFLKILENSRTWFSAPCCLPYFSMVFTVFSLVFPFFPWLFPDFPCPSCVFPLNKALLCSLATNSRCGVPEDGLLQGLWRSPGCGRFRSGHKMICYIIPI